MKTYNQNNFFKHTFCEFTQVDDFKFPENTNYKSKSESMYFYTDNGVYRKSNHWGRVANCRWKLIQTENYKNQKTVIGFAKWEDFYPINSSEKIFFINVNFTENLVKIQVKKSSEMKHTFTFSEAQKRVKQITYLINEYKWANYFNIEIENLRVKIISEYINSDKGLLQIKSALK